MLIVDRPLSSGFDLPTERFHLLSETELFDVKKLAGGKKKIRQSKEAAARFEELKVGEVVVHKKHLYHLYQSFLMYLLNIFIVVSIVTRVECCEFPLKYK